MRLSRRFGCWQLLQLSVPVLVHTKKRYNESVRHLTQHVVHCQGRARVRRFTVGTPTQSTDATTAICASKRIQDIATVVAKRSAHLPVEARMSQGRQTVSGSIIMGF